MERKFDKIFLDEQIVKAKKVLTQGDLSVVDKLNIESMIDKFNEYLDKPTIKKVEEDKKNNNKKYYDDLEQKLNKDLKLLDIHFWNKMRLLYNYSDLSEFKVKQYNNILIKEEDMLELILEFYKNMDKEYYKKALQIVQCPTSLINFCSNIITNDECFSCETLKAPFINIKSQGDQKYTALVHELGHGINYLYYGYKRNHLLDELGPMFFETIFIDSLDSFNNCEGLYSERINNHVNNLKYLNDYAKILSMFDKYGRKITKFNIKRILGVKTKEQLKNKYKRYMKINFLDCYCYTFSFYVCLKLRNKYYNESKIDSIEMLKKLTSGKSDEINFEELIKCYNEFIEEIKNKNNKFQKTVNM